jgi:hypothetical protein
MSSSGQRSDSSSHAPVVQLGAFVVAHKGHRCGLSVVGLRYALILTPAREPGEDAPTIAARHKEHTGLASDEGSLDPGRPLGVTTCAHRTTGELKGPVSGPCSTRARGTEAKSRNRQKPLGTLETRYGPHLMAIHMH